MKKVSPRLLALMMAGAVTVTSITPVTGYQTVTVNAATDGQEKEAAQQFKTKLIKETVLHLAKQQLRISYILQM